MPIVLEEHDDPVRDLNDFEWLGDTQQFRYAVGIAPKDRVIFFTCNHSWTQGWNGRVEPRLSPRRHRRPKLFIDDLLGVPLADPDPRQVARGKSLGQCRRRQTERPRE